MSTRTARFAIAVGLVVLLGIAVPVTRPTDASGYRDGAVQAAQASLSAVRMVALLAESRLAGETPGTYTDVVLDDAREAVARSVRDLAAEEVPDAASRALRDELSALLSGAVTAVGDAALAIDAADEAGIRGSAAALTALGDELERFVRTHR